MRCIGLLALLIAMIRPTLSDEQKSVPADHPERAKKGLILFRSSVRATLTTNCLECHGGKSVKGELDLTSRESLMSSGFVTDSADVSHLFQLITHAAEPHMPFKLPKLADEQIEGIRTWINSGSPYDAALVETSTTAAEMQVTDSDREFWSFRALQPVSPPAVQDSVWCRTPIDQFVRARQEAQNLTPNTTASRQVLIRRACFDLLGLPPTPEEVDAFVNDPDPDAWPKLIDRLLESQHYGERWARHWMDVARFAESHGYEQDYDRPNAFHYRDFLIRALNADLSYDKFVQWQLAGDELAPDEPLAMMATGFLGAGVFPTQLTEAEFESARYDELDDMVMTTGVSFLGLSVGCARCHDHKFDPIPSRDYYRLTATFSTAIRAEVDLELTEQNSGGQLVKVMVTSEGLPHLKHNADDRGFPHFYPETHLLKRGDVHQKQEVVTAGFLQALTPGNVDPGHWKVMPPENWTRTSFRRATLANWMTDPEHGAGSLAARVIVNRLWQHHFGRGLVATPNDFGASGERPSHPELLDWLASDLIEHGWTLKRVHKLMMTSQSYMQSGAYYDDRELLGPDGANLHDEQSAARDPARAAIDRENILLWRRTPHRLEAEAIRDAMLAVSGKLDVTQFGPGTLDQNMTRRSVYFFIKRSQLIPMMMLFDWPEHFVSIGQRPVTTIAPQALMFMNSPQGRDYSIAFAGRLPQDLPEAAIHAAWRLAFARLPSDAELQASLQFLTRQREAHTAFGHGDAKQQALVDLCQTILSMNEFVYVE